jgi:hypothetical protein
MTTTGAVPLLPVKFDNSKSEANYPRASVTLGGINLIPYSYEINLNAHGAADTANIVVPIGGNPDWTVQLFRSFSNADQPVYVSIYAGFASPGDTTNKNLQLRFSGIVDTYTMHLDMSNFSVEFNCRSLAAPLIDHKITTPLGSSTKGSNNIRTVDFIAQQVSRFGMPTPKINIAEAGTLQDVLGHEFVTGVKNWIIWNLILQCAIYDDADVWVDKHGVLHYESPQFVDRSKNKIYYSWGKTIAIADATHAVQYNKNIQVEVRSYSKRTKYASMSRTSSVKGGGTKTVNSTKITTSSPVFGTTTNVNTSTSSTGQTTTTVTSTTGGAASSVTGYASESGKEIYVYFVKNKTTQQCNNLAQGLWRQISMHEYQVEMTVPITPDALPLMDIISLITIENSPFSKLNQAYWPRKIKESFSTTGGWVWEIGMVNHELPQGAV